MQKEDSTFDALGNNPEGIVTLIGKNYKEFVANLEVRFPGKGKYIAKTLADSKQNRLYKTYHVFKKRCKKRKARLVYSPVPILKQLQKELERFVRAQYADHPNSHGFVPGKSTRTAAEQLRETPNINEKEVTNIDVKGAFPAVTGRVFRTLLRHKSAANLTPWQVNILAKIACNSEDRLATGSPASPAIFNWRLTAVDNELEKATQTRNWGVIRYADDITIIHYRTQKKDAIELVHRILKTFGLEIERSKLKTYRGQLKKIVGLNVQFGEITIPRKIRRTMRALAHYLTSYGIKPENRYRTTEEAFSNIRLIPWEARRRRGSVEAQLTGFFAYTIHTLQALKLTPAALRI